MNPFLAAAILAFGVSHVVCVSTPVHDKREALDGGLSLQIDAEVSLDSPQYKQKRAALSIAVNEGGPLSPEQQALLRRWDAQSASPQQKREALSVAANPDGSLSPEAQAALDRWEAQFGSPQRKQKKNKKKQKKNKKQKKKKLKQKTSSSETKPDDTLSQEERRLAAERDRRYLLASSSPPQRNQKREAVPLSPEAQAARDRWDLYFASSQA